MTIDYLGRQEQVAIFGDAIQSPRLDDISAQFQYNVSEMDIVSSTTGSGNVSHNGTNMMKLSAGDGGVEGTANAWTVDVVRYRTGHDIYALFTCVFSEPAENGKQFIGLMDENDGVGIGYNGTMFGVFIRRGGTTAFTSMNDFSRVSLNADDPTLMNYNGFEIDPQKINIYRINFGYLGVAPIVFEVYGGIERGWLAYHVMEYANRSNVTHINNPILPIRLELYSAGNAVLTMETPSLNAGIVIDRQDSKNDRNFVSENSKSGITTETNILTLSNKATFQTKTNHIAIEVLYLSVSADGTKNTTFRIRKDSTLGGTPSYADVDADNSVIEIDTAGTTVSATKIVFSGQVGKIESRYFDLSNQNIRIYPGERLTFSAASALSTEAYVSVGWRELF